MTGLIYGWTLTNEQEELKASFEKIFNNAMNEAHPENHNAGEYFFNLPHG